MASQNVIKVTDRNFEAEVLQSSLPVLVYFSNESNVMCQAQDSFVGKFADKNRGKVKVVNIDIDRSNLLAQKYDITTVPTFWSFEYGDVQRKYTGIAIESQLNETMGI